VALPVSVPGAAAMTDPREYFRPFEELAHADVLGDFDLGGMADELSLEKVQRALLSYLIREIDIAIWFDDLKDEEKEPQGKSSLMLLAFFKRGFVSKVDLIEMLEKYFENRNEIGDTEEIEALQRLRNVVDNAISARLEEKP
jgi:histidyl-tRNA synthetase